MQLFNYSIKIKLFVFIFFLSFSNLYSQICWNKIESKLDSNAAIKTDGTLWTWGENNNGALGLGSGTGYATSPTQVGGLSNWSKVSVGEKFMIAIKTDGTLWVWGRNNFGQLGNGTLNDSFSPIQIGNDNNWEFVEAGSTESFAIKTDGTLWAWGRNSLYQFGNGLTTNSNIPIQIGTENNWIKLSVHNACITALKSNGTIWKWGNTGFGSIQTPTQIDSSNNYIEISAGRTHNLAIKNDGSLWAWGVINNYGQFGNGIADANSNSLVPIQIGTSYNWLKVYAGENFSLGIKNDGTLWAWGRNNYGQFGNNTTTNSTIPIQIGTDNTWSNFSGGFTYTIAKKSDGTLWATGNNSSGSLGIGNFTSKLVFTPINCPTSVLNSQTFNLDANIFIYPNPASDSFQLNIDEKLVKIQVYNLLGQKVLSFNNTSTDYNISELLSGTYILEIETENSKYFSRLVKK